MRFSDSEAARYRGEGLWQDRTIAEEFHEVAVRHPDALALTAPDGRLTYAELDERSDRTAAGLHELGLMPGERVVFQLGNSVVTALAWYASLKAGLIPVCALVQHRRHEIGELARQSGAAAHLVQADQARFDMVAFGREIAGLQPSLRVLLTAADPSPHPGTTPLERLGEHVDRAQARALVEGIQEEIDPDDVAVFQLSGGTTSVPKIIPRFHAEYWYNARAYAEFWGWSPDARVAHLLPVIHNAGIVCALHGPHAVGAGSVLSRPEPELAAAMLSREGVTDVMINLALTKMALGHGPLAQAYLAADRLVFTGGPLPEHAATAFESSRPRIMQLFGMSEGLFMMTPPGAPAAVRHRTVGITMSPCDEVRICAPGSDVPLPDGAPGELCCRGPYTLKGYYDAAVHNRQAFTTDGFFRTGDIACARLIDGVRYYSIEGRIKDVISRGGEKVSAAEVEMVLLEHPHVADVALVAVSDERLGERACACIVPTPADRPLTLPDITAYMDARGLAKYKWPERLELFERLPRTSVGKVQKQALRAELEAKSPIA